MQNNLYALFLKASGVTTDTRQIKEGDLFFALKGPNFDGNDYAEKALEAGASAAVVSRQSLKDKPGMYWVEDTLLALQELAAFHRQQYNIPFIGITGSNGKTTSKELIAAVLKQRYKVHFTAGNLNNHIGVPLTLLRMPKDTEIAVIEMGANHVGEIAQLCKIAQPDFGYITNIGKAHIGEFGGFENILRAKSELFDFIRKNHGLPFINQHQPLLANMAKRFEKKVLFPEPDSDCPVALVEDQPFLKVKLPDGSEVRSQLYGTYNFDNIAAAIAMGQYFKVPFEMIREGIASYVPSNMRSQIIEKDGKRIVLDAYNANPESMEAAVDNFTKTRTGKGVLVLGEMLELGEDTEKEHMRLANQIAEHEWEAVFLVGNATEPMKKELPQAHYFDKAKELVEFLKVNPIAASDWLIKGSRKNALEDVMELWT